MMETFLVSSFKGLSKPVAVMTVVSSLVSAALRAIADVAHRLKIANLFIILTPKLLV